MSLRGVFLAALCCFMASCTSKAMQRGASMEKAIGEGDYPAMIENIKTNGKKLYGETNAFLYNMDIGVLFHYTGQYDSSNVYLMKAVSIHDELFAKSVTNEAASLLTNDNVRPYRSKPYELVMLHQLIALNFMAEGKFQEALVETRKSQLLMNEWERTQAKDGKYYTDGMSHLLSSLAYEGVKEDDNSLISLYKSVDAYKKGPVELPAEVEGFAYDRLKAGDRENDIKTLGIGQGGDSNKWSALQGESEIVVVGYVGRGPILTEQNWYGAYVPGGKMMLYVTGAAKGTGRVIEVLAPPLPAGKNLGGGSLNITVSLPELKTFPSNVSYFTAGVDGGAADFKSVVINDFDAQADKALKDAWNDILIRTIIRVALRTIAANEANKQAEKAGGGWAGLAMSLATTIAADQMEKADVRMCFLLPKTIQIARIPVAPGTHSVTLNVYNENGGVVGKRVFNNIDVKNGEKKVILAHQLKGGETAVEAAPVAVAAAAVPAAAVVPAVAAVPVPVTVIIEETTTDGAGEAAPEAEAAAEEAAEEAVEAVAVAEAVAAAPMPVAAAPVPVAVAPVQEAPNGQEILEALRAARGRPYVAVYVKDGFEDNEVKNALASELLFDLVNSGVYKSVDDGWVLAAEADKAGTKQGAANLTDSQIAQTLGGAKADLVCIVDAASAYGTLQVSARLIDVNSAVVVKLAVAEGNLANAEDYSVMVKKISDALIADPVSPPPAEPEPEPQPEPAAAAPVPVAPAPAYAAPPAPAPTYAESPAPAYAASPKPPKVKPAPKPRRKMWNSVGTGAFFAGGYNGGIEWPSGVRVAMPYSGGGWYAYFDLQEYVEIVAGYYYGGGKWMSAAASNSEKLPDMSHSCIDFGAFLKYPLGEGSVKWFPLFGLDYEIATSGELKYGGTTRSLESGNMSALWFKFGNGLDIDVGEKFYLRSELLFGWRTANSYEKDAVSTEKNYGSAAKTASGSGLSIKLGLGLKL